jgi:U32 family peptidase
MKIISTLYELNNLKQVLNLVDGIMVGNKELGTRLTHSFSMDEIIEITKTSQAMKKEVFISANQIFNDDQLNLFEKIIKQLPLEDVSGIIVADLGAYRKLKSLGYAHKTIYNPETLLANVYDFNFLSNLDLKGVYIAKEITLEDVITIGKQKKYEMFMVGHGHLNMFYSKRQLIDNFMHYQEQDNIYHERQDMKIIEENRPDDPYPILEDDAGTHVFRSQVFSSLEYLSELKEVVDYLIIDTLFKDDQYLYHIGPLYKNENIDLNVIADIQETYKEVWDDGFFHKKTIYKSKGNL